MQVDVDPLSVLIEKIVMGTSVMVRMMMMIFRIVVRGWLPIECLVGVVVTVDTLEMIAALHWNEL